MVRPVGPDGVEVTEVAEPAATDESDHLVEVHRVGVSFPDLLLSRGEYQLRPDPPFTLGVDFAGVVRVAPSGSALKPGTRVAGALPWGAAAEVVAVSADTVLPVPDALDDDHAAAVPMNYLTALFALEERAGLREGETLLVTGAAGGVGTAALQVGKGLGARTIGLVSTTDKAAVARRCGADEVVLTDGFLEEVQRLTRGHGVDVVLDVVGGDAFTDLIRVLAPQGRVLVVGFTGGTIPQVRVNRLLLANVDVRGVGWGAYALARPGYVARQWSRLLPMVESGVIDPALGSAYPLTGYADALREMADRRTLGKTIISVNS